MNSQVPKANADAHVSSSEPSSDKERLIKQLNQVICICNGIKLAKIIPALKNSETVEDVNRKAGTGCGGCRGQRCGPRIAALLRARAGKRAEN